MPVFLYLNSIVSHFTTFVVLCQFCVNFCVTNQLLLLREKPLLKNQYSKYPNGNGRVSNVKNRTKKNKLVSTHPWKPLGVNT